MIGEDDLEEGSLRMLEVDNRLVIPELTHVRFVITSADVIHAFASPSLGIKCDAYPGRLNQVSVLINREGVFLGLPSSFFFFFFFFFCFFYNLCFCKQGKRKKKEKTYWNYEAIVIVNLWL
jgi:hypothetical protein